MITIILNKKIRPIVETGDYSQKELEDIYKMIIDQLEATLDPADYDSEAKMISLTQLDIRLILAILLRARKTSKK